MTTRYRPIIVDALAAAIYVALGALPYREVRRTAASAALIQLGRRYGPLSHHV